MEQRPEFARIAGEIEAELRALNAWDAEPPSPEAIANGGAFGGRTMAFTQWLQWVLIPRLQEVASGASDIPPSSSVGAYAVRELDGWNEASSLISKLSELDRLVGHAPPKKRHPWG
jgi:uncharacterized protein YqcC (DUF446 family)